MFTKSTSEIPEETGVYDIYHISTSHVGIFLGPAKGRSALEQCDLLIPLFCLKFAKRDVQLHRRKIEKVYRSFTKPDARLLEDIFRGVAGLRSRVGV